ncbi:MAG: RNA 2',3'-cyclic phosphodiesterase [Halobacteriota archaeon]
MRCFVAVDVPDDLTEAIVDLQSTLRDAEGLRFVDPGGAHVTLKFLGEVPQDRLEETIDAVDAAVEAAGVAPFACTIGGLGVFPSPSYISVVWTGVKTGRGDLWLRRLHAAIERETTAIGYEAESHEFTPHVTIARMDDARGKTLVQDALASCDPTIGTFTVRDVRLKRRVRSADGPPYRTIERFELPKLDAGEPAGND